METRQLGKTDMQVSVLGFRGVEIDGTSLADVEQLLGSALDSDRITANYVGAYRQADKSAVGAVNRPP